MVIVGQSHLKQVPALQVGKRGVPSICLLEMRKLLDQVLLLKLEILLVAVVEPSLSSLEMRLEVPRRLVHSVRQQMEVQQVAPLSWALGPQLQEIQVI